MGFDSVDIISNRHAGETILVVGTSGSLNELDMSLTNRFTTIGCNDALDFFISHELPLPQYLLTAEVTATRRAIDDLKANPHVTLLTKSREAEFARGEGFTGPIFTYSLTTKTPVPVLHGPVKQMNNTSLYAIQIAVRLRGTATPGRIVLVGVDMRYPTAEEEVVGRTNHHHGDGTIDGCKPNFESPLHYYPGVTTWLRGRGIELVTASPWDGPLTSMLSRVKLEDLA